MSTLAMALARSLKTTTSLSMESVDVDINIGTDAVTDEDGAAVSPLSPATDEPIVEAQETEIAEETVEVDDTSDDIDDADSDVETLESIQLHLQASLESGGLDTPSFEMFGIAMDHIYRKYGITSAAVMPSMEAFGNNPLEQTQISMEKVSDTLKTVAEGAKELLKKLWFKIKQLITSLVTLSFSMEKRVTAIYKKSKDLAADTSQKEEIKLYSGNRLHIGGKVPAKPELIKNYITTAGNVSGLGKVCNDYFELFIKTAGMAKANRASENSKVAELAKQLSEVTDKLTGQLTFQDAKFETTVPEDIKKGAVTKFITSKAPERDAESSGYKVVPLTPGEVGQICDKMRDSLSVLKEFSKPYSRRELEALINEMSTLPEDDKEESEGLQSDRSGSDLTQKQLAKQAQAQAKAALMMHGKVMNYISSINKAMLDYCAQSLSAYKGGDKPEAKKDEKTEEKDAK